MPHWALRVNVSKEEWVGIVNAGGYPNERKIVYEIVRLDNKGNVIAIDGIIHDAGFNICQRLREAINKRMLYEQNN